MHNSHDFYLQVFDGGNSSAQLGAKMTANGYQNYLSSGNEVFMEFRTGLLDSDDGRWYGFKLQYFEADGNKNHLI